MPDYNSEIVQQLLRQIEVYEDVLKPIARAAIVTDRDLVIHGNTSDNKEAKHTKGVLEHRHLQAADDALRAFGREYPIYQKRGN